MTGLTAGPVDLAAVAGLLVIGVVAIASVVVGGDGGLQVASAAVGGIAGWLARGGKAPERPVPG